MRKPVAAISNQTATDPGSQLGARQPPTEIVFSARRRLRPIRSRGAEICSSLARTAWFAATTNANDVARLLDDAKPNLMVADPPYGLNYDPAWRNRVWRKNGTGSVRVRSAR